MYSTEIWRKNLRWFQKLHEKNSHSSIQNGAFGLWSSKNKFTLLTFQSFFDIWLWDIPFIIWSRMFTLEEGVEKVLIGIMLVLLVAVSLVVEWSWDGWFTGVETVAVSLFFFEESAFIWLGNSKRDIPWISKFSLPSFCFHIKISWIKPPSYLHSLLWGWMTPLGFFLGLKDTTWKGKYVWVDFDL